MPTATQQQTSFSRLQSPQPLHEAVVVASPEASDEELGEPLQNQAPCSTMPTQRALQADVADAGPTAITKITLRVDLEPIVIDIPENPRPHLHSRYMCENGYVGFKTIENQFKIILLGSDSFELHWK